MKPTTYRCSLALAALAFSFALAPAAAAEGYSHARIVRLSFVEGTVTLLRPGAGAEWANASVNTPIQEGFQLSTDKNSFAEVQFENGSTARLGELSLVRFDQLAMSEDGNEVNRLVLDHGYGTFQVSPEKVEVFEVRSGDATFKPQGKSQFRVDLGQDQVRVEVFKGSLEVESSEINTTLARNTVLEIRPGAEEAYNVSQGIKRDDWDEWVSQRDQQEAAATPPGGYIQGSPSYGWSDLNQYGTWSYFDGYGYGWVPDAGGLWSPFGLGQWSWYPGFGYTWLSYEPWGWLPYHFGGWSWNPLFGWAWFPGSSWGWSPGVVNWYQGPGWVGWVPRGPSSAPGLGGGLLPPAKPCPAGASGCMRAVNTAILQRGGPLTSRQFIKVPPTEGAPVKEPTVEPSLLAQLPGSPARLSSAQQAVISGTPASREPFTARLSPESRQWEHRAPASTFASAPPSAPAEVRHEVNSIWGGRAVSGGSFRPAGGFSAASHGDGGGGVAMGHSSGGISSGGMSSGGVSGGGSHSGAASGGGGGHH
ncbi:MAG TPA: FecR family protein [Terriglobia bacterium]